MCVHSTSLRRHHNHPRSPIIHPRSAASAAPLSYYRRQVQMVKGRCSAEKKKGKVEEGGKKKEQAPGPSVVTVWGCSHYD